MPRSLVNLRQRQFGDLRAVQRIGVDIGERMERRKRFKDYWNDSLQDVHYAFRTLGRDPGFAASQSSFWLLRSEPTLPYSM